MDSCTPSPAEPINAPPELVAETLPPHESPPVRAWGVHWVFAPVAAALAVFLPRRMGPYLAASPLRAAYVAHFSALPAVLVVLFLCAMTFESPPGGPLTGSEWLRAPFALVVCMLIDAPVPLAVLAASAVGLVLVEGGVWVAAMVLMPWYAAGERGKHLYFRCLKLMLWSTWTALFLPLLFAGIMYWGITYGEMGYFDEEVVVTVIFEAWPVWGLWIMLRWGDRYGGPAEGPGFEPRQLHCDGCNYQLTFQPVAGRCPECGRAVADSLPGRRRLPAFAAQKNLLSRLAAFPSTLFSTFAACHFGATLAVHSGRRQAREFAMLVCGLVGVIAWGLLPLYWPSVDQMSYVSGRAAVVLYEMMVVGVIAWTWIVGALSTAGVLLTVAWLLTIFGWVDPARRGLVLCYSSGWLVVTALFMVGGIWGGYWVLEYWRPDLQWEWPLIGWISADIFLAALLMLPAPACVLLWLLQLRHMLRATRYANA